MYFYNDEDAEPDLREVQATVIALGQLVFMSHRPDRIAPARWTGVEACASIFGSLSCLLDALKFMTQEAKNSHLQHTRSHRADDDEDDNGDGDKSAASNSVRWRLFSEWTATTWSCKVGSYMICTLSSPTRNLLMYIFAHADGHGVDEEKFSRKYMFCVRELRRRRAAIQAGDTGFAEWCSGRVTGKSLAEYAEMLTGGNGNDTISNLLNQCLPRVGGDTEAHRKTLWRTSNVMIVRGASTLEYRMHRDLGSFPLVLFRLSDPQLKEADLNKCAANISKKFNPECSHHLDPFTFSMVGKHGSSVDGLLKLAPKCRVICKRAHLGIFQSECMHADVRQSGLCSTGAAKSLPAASKDILLSKFHLYHVQRFGFRSVSDFWRRDFAKGRKRVWGVKRKLAKLKDKTNLPRLNGYVVFRRSRLRAVRNVEPHARRLCMDPEVEAGISQAWNALSAVDKARYAADARVQNKLNKRFHLQRAGGRGNREGGESFGALEEATSSPWGLGDPRDPKTPLRPDALGEVRSKFMLSKSSASQVFRDKHKTVDPKPGLADLMDITIAQKKETCCQTLGICRQRLDALHPHAFGHALLMHKVIVFPSSRRFESNRRIATESAEFFQQNKWFGVA